MKKYLILFVIYSFSLACAPLTAQDRTCMDMLEVARKYRDEKKWEQAKVECNSFLNNCYSSAEVLQILKECDENLSKKKQEVESSTTTPASSSQKEVEKRRFVANKKYVEFPESGGSENIKISTDSEWDIYEEPDWVETQQTGNTLTVTCGRNYRPSAREGDIVLYDDNNQQLRIVVAQDKNNDYLKLSATIIDDSKGKGACYTIHVSSNKSWIVKNSPRWCTIRQETNRLSITLERNKTNYARQAEVEVVSPQSDFLKQVITIKQEPYKHYINISPRIITADDGKSGIATISVDTDYDSYRVANLPYWCTLQQKNADSFVIDIDDNSGGQARTAQCKVIAGDQVETFTIEQGSRLTYINAFPQIITAGPRGGSITIKVNSSGKWRIVNLPDWCQTTDQTETSFSLEISSNDGGPRTATFSVSTAGERCNLTIKQE